MTDATIGRPPGQALEALEPAIQTTRSAATINW